MRSSRLDFARALPSGWAHAVRRRPPLVAGGCPGGPAPPPGFGQRPPPRAPERAHCRDELGAGVRGRSRQRGPLGRPRARRPVRLRGGDVRRGRARRRRPRRPDRRPRPRPSPCSPRPWWPWPSTRCRPASRTSRRAPSRAATRRRTTCCGGSPAPRPGGYPAEELPSRMARVLAEGTGAAWAQVWLVVDDRPTLAATWPPRAGDTTTRDPVLRRRPEPPAPAR